MRAAGQSIACHAAALNVRLLLPTTHVRTSSGECTTPPVASLHYHLARRGGASRIHAGGMQSLHATSDSPLNCAWQQAAAVERRTPRPTACTTQTHPLADTSSERSSECCAAMSSLAARRCVWLHSLPSQLLLLLRAYVLSAARSQLTSGHTAHTRTGERTRARPPPARAIYAHRCTGLRTVHPCGR